MQNFCLQKYTDDIAPVHPKNAIATTEIPTGKLVIILKSIAAKTHLSRSGINNSPCVGRSTRKQKESGGKEGNQFFFS